MNEFLWVGLPYVAFTVLVFGTILRYLFAEQTWTTKSSQFLAKKSLRIPGPLFHMALFIVLGGHIAGILIPKSFTESMGISEHMYHLGAVYGGGLGGTLLVIGFLMLFIRRFGTDRMCVNTSKMDLVLFLGLAFAIFTGYACAASQVFQSFDYRVTIGPWFRGLLFLNPQPELMENIPLLFKIHMMSWMFVAIIFPFTRVVHCLSFPFSYIWRKAIVFRTK